MVITRDRVNGAGLDRCAWLGGRSAYSPAAAAPSTSRDRHIRGTWLRYSREAAPSPRSVCFRRLRLDKEKVLISTGLGSRGMLTDIRQGFGSDEVNTLSPCSVCACLGRCGESGACCRVKLGRLLLPVGEKKREMEMCGLWAGSLLCCVLISCSCRINQFVTTTSENAASPSVHLLVANCDALKHGD